MSASNGEDLTPPYMSFTTFQSFLGHLKESTIPPKIDRTVMTGKSGAVKSQIRTTFTFLGLMTKDEESTDRLRRLVSAYGTDEWASTLREIVKDAYAPFLTGLPLKDGTAGQLHEKFREVGDASGSTHRKAIRFFLNALEASGIEHSPHFKPPKAPRRTRSRKTSKKSEEKSTTPKKSQGGGADHEGSGPSDYEEIRFPLPRRPSPVTIFVPDDIADYEWDMVDMYIRSYIDAANMEQP